MVLSGAWGLEADLMDDLWRLLCPLKVYYKKAEIKLAKMLNGLIADMTLFIFRDEVSDQDPTDERSAALENRILFYNCF